MYGGGRDDSTLILLDEMEEGGIDEEEEEKVTKKEKKPGRSRVENALVDAKTQSAPVSPLKSSSCQVR